MASVDETSEAERLRREVADLRVRIHRYERHAESFTDPCCLEYAEAAAMAVEQAGNAGFMQAAADSWASSMRNQKARAEKAETERDDLLVRGDQWKDAALTAEGTVSRVRALADAWAALGDAGAKVMRLDSRDYSAGELTMLARCADDLRAAMAGGS